MLQNYSMPPRFRDMRAGIAALKAAHKDRLRVFSAGRSVLGRPITVLGLGDMRGASLFVGGVHGSEWLTVTALLKYLRQRLEGDGDNDTGSGRGLLIVPCLNPDGVEIAIAGTQTAGRESAYIERIWQDKSRPWQANARGVDINHNFDAGWQELRRLELLQGIRGPAPSRYGGEAPFSEPESRAAANLCVAFGVRKVFAFHSQGEEIYWRYGERTPSTSQREAELLAEASGYTVAQPQGTAAHGGLKDWFIQTTGRAGFTIEIGRGKNPLPAEDFPEIYEKLAPLLTLAAEL